MQAPEKEKSSISWGCLTEQKLQAAPRKRKNIHLVGLFCRYKVRDAAAHYVSLNKRSYKLLQ